MQEKVNVSSRHNLKAYFYQLVLIHAKTQCTSFHLKTGGLSVDMCSKQQQDNKVMIKHWKTDVFSDIIIFLNYKDLKTA